MTADTRFRVLFFDFDDTLVPELTVADQVLREIADEIRRVYPAAQNLKSGLQDAAGRLIHRMNAGAVARSIFGVQIPSWYGFELIWDDKSPLEELSPHIEDFRLATWSETFKALGISDDLLSTTAATRLPASVKARRKPYADSDTVLTGLRQVHGLALITNGEPVLQAAKVERSGLRHHFAHVVLADEYGSKPNPGPFDHAMDLMDCRPDEVAMIGNSIATDIAGASGRGIYSIWVQRDGWNEEPTKTAQPDATIRELGELPELLARA